jgi:fumarate reductase flavoprotein subunit
MPKFFILLLTFILSVFLSAAFAAGEEKALRGKHLEAELSCADCHGTDTPEKKASQKACKGCHEGMENEPPVIFIEENGVKHEVNPHNAHPGQMRCTLCHSIHKPSTLYCNEGCHHTFSAKVP